jgi:osmotically inducible protein OsmC
MPVRIAEAFWNGTLKEGAGRVRLGSGAFEGPYSFTSRFEEGAGTNPEELVGAAHAGCFSMAFASALGQAGFPPERIHTTAHVSLDKGRAGFRISRIELQTEAQVPGIGETAFTQVAEQAKRDCPLSRALAGVSILLKATLLA